MKFEDRMRQLASAILQLEADTLAEVDPAIRMQLSILGDPETALLVAEVLAAARFRVKCESVGDNPAWLRKSIEALDAHFKKGNE